MTAAILWGSPRDRGAVSGVGLEGRLYLVEPAGDRWRWSRGTPGVAGSYAAGAFESREAAQKHAEHHEAEDVEMAKKEKKDKGGAKAAKANGAAHAKTEPAPAPTLAPAKDAKELGRYTDQLPVKLDADERAALEGKLAALTCERHAAETEMATVKERVKGLKKREDAMADELSGGEELRDVECVSYLLPTNEVQVVRTDTGEVVETRTAEAADLQEPMFEGDDVVATGGIDVDDEIPFGNEPLDHEVDGRELGDGAEG